MLHSIPIWKHFRHEKWIKILLTIPSHYGCQKVSLKNASIFEKFLLTFLSSLFGSVLPFWLAIVIGHFYLKTQNEAKICARGILFNEERLTPSNHTIEMFKFSYIIVLHSKAWNTHLFTLRQVKIIMGTCWLWYWCLYIITLFVP